MLNATLLPLDFGTSPTKPACLRQKNVFALNSYCQNRKRLLGNATFGGKKINSLIFGVLVERELRIGETFLPTQFSFELSRFFWRTDSVATAN